MSYWDKNPKNFRTMIIIISAVMLVLTIQLFYKNVSSTTDENTYGEPSSRFYIDKTFAASLFDTDAAMKNFPDSIRAGSLILGINGDKPKDLDDLLESINKLKDDELIQIVATNPSGNMLGTKRYLTKKKYLPEDFVEYLPFSLIIYSVDKDGASERAGIKVGDIILKANGKPITTLFDADNILRSSDRGNTITYQILREGVVSDIEVTLAQFGVPFSYLVLFINSILLFAFGAFIAIARPNIKAARILGVGFILLARIFLPVGNRFYFDTDFMFLIQHFFSILAISFAFPVLFHSTAYFPNEKSVYIKKKWITAVPYFVGLICFMVLFYLHNISLKNSYDFRVYILILNNGLIAFVLYFIMINLIFRKQKDKEQRKRGILIFRTVTLVFIAISSTLFFREWELRRTIADFIILLVPLIPAAYLFTIGRYKLLDLHIRIKRNIQYTGISVILRAIVIILIFLSIWLFAQYEYTLPNIHLTGTSLIVLKNPLNPIAHKAYENGILMCFSILSFLIFWKIGDKVQMILDKKFYRTRFDYKRASTEFSEILATNIGVNELAKGIVNELAELIHLKRVGIVFVKDEERVVGQAYFGFKSKEFQEFCSVTGKTLVESIKQFHGAFCTCYLQAPLKDVFESYKLQYIIPITSKRSIVGAFIVGEKLSEMSFHSEDMEFLSSVAGQTSVAIENSFLYEDLAQQERIKHELSIARRIQLASLPQSTPDNKSLDISGISLPAMEVGGDFYDYLNGKADSIMIIVGDVSGKGTSAALYMSKIQGIMRTLNDFSLSPRDLFVRSNLLITKYLEKSSYITAIAASFDTEINRLSLARAGHLPIYYFNSKTKQIERIIPKGILLGMTKNKVFEENMEQYELDYTTGDIFLFLTDGVIEARSKDDDDYGEERLIKYLLEHVNYSSAEIRDKLIDAVNIFSAGIEQFDDLTIVVVKVK